MVLRIFLILCLLFTCYSYNAEGAFNDIPVDAKQAGSGGGSVSVVDDAYACVYNPAGIVDAGKLSVATTFYNKYGIPNYYVKYFGIASESYIPSGAAGLGFVQESVTGIVSKNRLSLSYAYKIKNISCGVNIKYLSFVPQGIYEDENDRDDPSINTKAYFSSDIGIQYYYDSEFRFGISYYNIPFSKNSKENINSSMRMGGSYKFLEDATCSFDLVPKYGIKGIRNLSVEINTGVEIRVQNRFAFRAGYNGNSLTAGAGVRVSWLEFSYAFSAHQFFSGTHIFSLSMEMK